MNYIVGGSWFRDSSCAHQNPPHTLHSTTNEWVGNGSMVYNDNSIKVRKEKLLDEREALSQWHSNTNYTALVAYMS